MVIMTKLNMILTLCTVAIMAVPIIAQGVDQSPKAVEKWFKRLPHAKEKLTKFHFYFHDVVSGNNPTAVQVAQANSTFESPTFFGLFRVFDNPLTVGPEPTSKIIGRAQGTYGFASKEDLGLLMTLNIVFTEGKYNGSTLSLLGHNPILNKYREITIHGGSGVFRLARGVATAQTFTFNLTSQDAIVEYNVVVMHY